MLGREQRDGSCFLGPTKCRVNIVQQLKQRGLNIRDDERGEYNLKWESVCPWREIGCIVALVRTRAQHIEAQ